MGRGCQEVAPLFCGAPQRLRRHRVRPLVADALNRGDRRRRVIEAGDGSVIWDGANAEGRGQASGVHFCRAQALGKTLTRKVTLVE